jgi:heme/copper-type cytochrome/quinol oxidase subunit 2
MRSNRLPVFTHLLALVALTSAAVACHGGMHRGHHGFTSDTSTIQVVTTELGGKNVFIPSTIVVTSGHPVKLSIFNTTDVPHGFAIPALNVATVLPAKAEQEIELPALEGHQILQIKCHLHEKHRTATLVVLPAREAD